MTSAEASALLGVPEGSPFDVIQHAFVRAAREAHPDRFAQGSDEERTEASARFRLLAEAREVLLRTRPIIPVQFDVEPPVRKAKGIGGSVVVLLIVAALLVLGVTMADGYRMDTVQNLRGGTVEPR